MPPARSWSSWSRRAGWATRPAAACTSTDRTSFALCGMGYNRARSEAGCIMHRLGGILGGALGGLMGAEREEAGRPVQMPPQDLAETVEESYPRDVWTEATRRWETFTPHHRNELRELPWLANPQVYLVYLADEVVDEYQEEGRTVEW